MQFVNMYANKNGDANKCIAISEFHKNFLVFANPSSNRSEGLCLKGFLSMRGCSNPSQTPQQPLMNPS